MNRNYLNLSVVGAERLQKELEQEGLHFNIFRHKEEGRFFLLPCDYLEYRRGYNPVRKIVSRRSFSMFKKLGKEMDKLNRANPL